MAVLIAVKSCTSTSPTNAFPVLRSAGLEHARRVEPLHRPISSAPGKGKASLAVTRQI